MTLLDDRELVLARCRAKGWLGLCMGQATHVLAVTCPAGHRQTRGVCYFHGYHPPEEVGDLGFCPVCVAGHVPNPLLLSEPAPVGGE